MLENHRRVIEWLTARDEIQQAYYISGTADLLLIIIAPDVSVYDRLTSELVTERPAIKRITTSVVFRELKASLVVPI